MRMTHLRFVVASCAFALAPLSAQAQEQPQTRQAGQAAQQPDQDIPQRGDTLRDGQREQAGQRDQPRGQAQQRGQQTQQRGQAGQREQDGQQIGQPRAGRSEQGRAGSQQGQKGVEDFLVQRLIHANKGEIELSQLATQEAQHEEVKQFAQKMVQDHQQLLQKLQQHAGQPSGAQAGQPAGRTQPGQTAQTQPGQTQPGQDQGEQRRPGQTQTEQGQPGQAGMRGQQVPQQLTQVVDQAAKTHLQMSKQMLEDADDFDMAYMGMAVIKHSMMVAELEAMQSVGSQEFQQLVSTAEGKTREHLEHAKKLVKKLDSGDRQATSPGRQASTRQPADQQQPGTQPGTQPTRRGGQTGTPGTN